MLNGSMVFGLVFRAKSNIENLIMREISAIKKFDFSLAGAQAQLARMSNLATNAILGLGAAGLLGVFIAGTAAAGKLEDQLQMTRIVTEGLFESNMALGGSLLTTSNRVGVFTTELSRMAEIAGTAGLNAQFAKQDFLEFTDIASKLAKVSRLSATDSSQILAQAARRLNFQSAIELERYASALQAVGKRSIAGTAEVARYATGLIPLKNVARFTTAEILALAGAAKSFGNLTVEVLQTNLPKFLREASLHAGVVGQKLGMTADEINRMIELNPFQFFVRFLEYMHKFDKNLPATAKALDEMGIKSQRIFTIIAGGSGQISHLTDLLKAAQPEIEGTAHTLETDFNAAMSTLVSQMTRFKIVMTNLSIVMGMPFVKPLTIVLKLVNGIVSGLVDLGKSPFGQLALEAVGWASALIVIKGLIYGISVLLLPFLPILDLIPGAIAAAASSFLGMVWFVTKILLVLKAIGAVVGMMFGPGLARAGELFRMIADGVSDFLADSKVSLDTWVRMEEEGVLPIVLAIFKLVKMTQAFLYGFWKGFEPFFEGLGESFSQLVDATFELLQSLGLISLELGGPGTKGARKFGVALGSAFGLMARAVMYFVEGPLTILIKGLTAAANIFDLIVKSARFLLAFTTFGGSSGLNLIPELNAPSAAPLPLKAPGRYQDVGRDVIGMANVARQRMTEGAEPPKNGYLGSLTMFTDLIMDGQKVGRALAERYLDTKQNRTGLRDINDITFTPTVRPTYG